MNKNHVAAEPDEIPVLEVETLIAPISFKPATKTGS